MLKSSAAGAVTVKLYVALCHNEPLTPVTVIVYEPVGVDVVVEIVNVLVNVGLPLVGFTVAVSPVVVGEIDVDNVTDCVVPLTRETVTVEVVPLPRTTDPLDGFRSTEKSNAGGAPKAPIWLITVFQFWNVESNQQGQTGDQTGDQTGEHADNNDQTQTDQQTNDDNQAGDQTQAGDQGQVGENTNTDKATADTTAQVGQTGQVVSQGHPNGPANAGDQTGLDQQAQSGSDTNVEYAQTGPAMA